MAGLNGSRPAKWIVVTAKDSGTQSGNKSTERLRRWLPIEQPWEVGSVRLMTYVVLFALCSMLACAIVPAQEADEFERARTEMLNRQRRVILNNDGGDAVVTADEPTVEAMLAERTVGLEDTHVDTIFYCTNRGTFSRHSHQSEVSETFTRTDGRYSKNLVPVLAEMGTDPIEVMVEWCRDHDMEIFWSERMNDRHDAGRPKGVSEWKKEHPECLVGSPEDRPPHGAWSQVDYAHQAVRDQMFAIIQEVCQNYDVDGIEMDFFRHPCYFRTVAWGGHATDEERDLMTGFVRRVRKMTERVGRERGRPFLVAIRVPDSVPLCHAMGLDLHAWLSEGLVDIVTGSGYFRMNPWSSLGELGDRYDVKVFAGLSDSRVNAERTVINRRGTESYRGRAERAWQGGVDGIYLFNMFNPHKEFLNEIGDPEVLAGLDRTFVTTVRGARKRSYGSPDYWIADGSQWQNVPVITPEEPVAVEAGETRSVPIELGADPWVATDRRPMDVTLHLMATGASQVAINGHALEQPDTEDMWRHYKLSEGQVRPGQNVVAVTAERETANEGITWNAETVPKEPWTHHRLREGATIAEIRDGAMLVADRGEEQGDYVYFNYPWGADPEQPAEVVAEVKVLDGWNNITVSNGEAIERVTLYPDHIGTHYTNLHEDFDTSDDWHTYRVVIQNDDLRVYVDGELLLDGEGALTHPSRGRNTAAFGAANSPSTGEALWRSIHLESPGLAGAQLYDAAVTVRFPGE